MGPPCTTVKNGNFYMDLVFNHTGLEEGQLVQTAGASASKGGENWAIIKIEGTSLLVGLFVCLSVYIGHHVRMGSLPKH